MTYSITISPYDNIQLFTGKLNTIEINNYSLLDRLQFEVFNNQFLDDDDNTNELIHIFEDNEYVNINKKVFIIPDILDFDVSSKKIQNAIIKKLLAESDDDTRKEAFELNNELNQFINRMILNYDLPLSYEEESKIEDFLKLKKISVNDKLNNSYFDCFLTIIEIISEFFNDNLIVFYNLLYHFSDEQLKEVTEFIKIKETNILLFERDVYFDDQDLSNLNHFKIDDDFVMFNMND